MPEYILGIDCASEGCAAALLREGDVISQRQEFMARGQDSRLLVLVQEVLAEAQLSFAELNAIAVTTGPGSFTGIRIGLAAAAGIGLAADKPVLGFNRFKILEHQLGCFLSGTDKQSEILNLPAKSMHVLEKSGLNKITFADLLAASPLTMEKQVVTGIATIIASKRAELFCRLVTCGGDIEFMAKPEEILAKIIQLKQPHIAQENAGWILLGDGADIFLSICAQANSDGIFQKLAFKEPEAVAAAILARHALISLPSKILPSDGLFQFTPRPYYMRPPDVTFPKNNPLEGVVK